MAERGVVFHEANGWKVMLNPNPLVKELPDEKVYMAISPKGNTYCGNKGTIMYLVDDPDTEGWRKRNE